MKTLRTLILTGIFVSIAAHTSAQKFTYSLNAGYTQIKYSFPVEKDRYHTSDIQPFSALKGGASVHYLLSNALRLQTGLEYISVEGTRDGGHVQRTLANPNSGGRMQFDIKNSFLIIPVGFQLYLGGQGIRPFMSGAMNFFKPNIHIEIEPEEYDPFYEKVSTTVVKSTKNSAFGARVGVGVSFSAFATHEISLALNRHFNLSRYDLGDRINGIFERHEIRFNMWEVGVVWTFDFQKS